ncbi:hypothetical protein ILUMI_20527, partial [Ignelater luminosus]
MSYLQKLRNEKGLTEKKMLFLLYNNDPEFEKLTAEEPASDEESVDNIPEDKLVDDKVLADDNEADNEEAEQASKMPTVVPYLFTYVAKDGTQWVKVMLEPDVILLSSEQYDDKINGEENEYIPDIILHYNATKGVVDQMAQQYTTQRNKIDGLRQEEISFRLREDLARGNIIRRYRFNSIQGPIQKYMEMAIPELPETNIADMDKEQ